MKRTMNNAQFEETNKHVLEQLQPSACPIHRADKRLKGKKTIK